MNPEFRYTVRRYGNYPVEPAGNFVWSSLSIIELPGSEDRIATISIS
jgi:hypothetical protein